MKKFHDSFEKLEMETANYRSVGGGQRNDTMHEESHDSDEDDSVIEDIEEDRNAKKKAMQLEKLINNNISKFYPIDKNEELENDIDTDDLVEISEDEKQQDDDHVDLLNEDNKKISQDHARKIQQQMN
jgi:hypothetical protein